MAYMSQEKKKALAPKIKAICKKYGIKATLAVRHHSTLVLNIAKGKIDFLKYANDNGYIQVNEYWLDRDYEGDALNFLEEIKVAMNDGNFDNSDPMTDYFHVGWYTSINVGRWNKPYIFEA